MIITKKRCLAGRLIFTMMPLLGGEWLAMAQHFPGRPAQHAPTVYVYCYASTEKLYLSNIFALGANRVMGAGNAFTDFLKGHYSFSRPPGVSCTPNNTTQLAQDGKERTRTYFLRSLDQNHQTGSVIETHWTYPGSAEPATASPPSPSPTATAPAPQSTPAAPVPQPPAVAQAQTAGSIASSESDASIVTGVYGGYYRCGAQNRDLKLSVRGERDGTLSALFSFRPTPKGNFASFRMSGLYNTGKKHITLEPIRWETAAPGGFVMVSLAGTYIPAEHKIGGVIQYGNCGGFVVTLDRSQSPDF